jgi:hypothetical protein
MVFSGLPRRQALRAKGSHRQLQRSQDLEQTRRLAMSPTLRMICGRHPATPVHIKISSTMT